MPEGVWAQGGRKVMLEKRAMQWAAVFLAALTIGLCSLLLHFPNFHQMAVDRRLRVQTADDAKVSVLDLLRDNEQLLSGEFHVVPMEKQLRLELPEGVGEADVSCRQYYMDRTLEIVIDGIGRDYFEKYSMVGSSDHVEDVTYESAGGEGVISIVLDGVYEADTAVKEGYLYIGFLQPHEVYDYVVVVDAGHGGAASGATKQGVSEKDIDLAIVLELQEIFQESGANIGVYYTRLDDSNPTFAQRVGLANGAGADLFLSIHNNSTSSGRMSSIRGTQVMYYSLDETGRSQRFAQKCLDQVTSVLGSVDNGLMKGDNIYILHHAQVPAALVEVGFMTNRQELALLNSPEYQRMAATALYQAIMETLEELYG